MPKPSPIQAALDSAEARDDRSRYAAEAVRDVLIKYDGKPIPRNAKRIGAAVAALFPGKRAALRQVAFSHWSIVVQDPADSSGYLHYITVCYGQVYDAAKFKDINSSQYAGVDNRRSARSVLAAQDRIADGLVERRNKARAALEAADRDIVAHLVDVEAEAGFPVKDALSSAIAEAIK